MKTAKDLPPGQVAAEIGLMTATVIGEILDELAPEGDPRRVRIIERLRVASAKLSEAGAVSHQAPLHLLLEYLSPVQ
jgi:hypothetical protein